MFVKLLVMKKLVGILTVVSFLAAACSSPEEMTLREGSGWTSRHSYADVLITGQAFTEEGGVGRMLADDAEVYEYYGEISGEPFLFGVQGEGRKWKQTFSAQALGIFEYLFTDAMTIYDHKGRNSRIYRPEEVHFDGIDKEGYMDHLVEQTVRILTDEPADIYANPTFLPDEMQPAYDHYWTAERVDRILDVLARYRIALEINPRYRIPGFDIIRRAKERGIKFTFGTNNVDADFGRLEYAVEAIEACGLTPEDIWFPSMSIRSTRL